MTDTISSMKEAILKAMATLGGQRLSITQIWDEIYKGLDLPDDEFDAMSQSYDMAMEDLMEESAIVKHGNGSYSL